MKKLLLFIFLIVISFTACNDNMLVDMEENDKVITIPDRDKSANIFDGILDMEINSSSSSSNNYINCFDITINSISEMNVNIQDVGKIHNKLLDFQWNFIKENPIIDENITAEEYFSDMYSSFFKTYGIDINFLLKPFEPQMKFEVGDYNGFINSLTNESEFYRDLTILYFEYLNEYINGITSDSIFLSKMEKIRIEAFNLTNISERMNVLSAVEVVVYSFEYWSKNTEAYTKDIKSFIERNYSKFNIERNQNTSDKLEFRHKYNLKEMLEWDATGAYEFGKWGLAAAGGPAGAIACGLAGGAGASAVNLIWQRIWL